jgi:hypothetical protein
VARAGGVPIRALIGHPRPRWAGAGRPAAASGGQLPGQRVGEGPAERARCGAEGGGRAGGGGGGRLSGWSVVVLKLPGEIRCFWGGCGWARRRRNGGPGGGWGQGRSLRRRDRRTGWKGPPSPLRARRRGGGWRQVERGVGGGAQSAGGDSDAFVGVGVDWAVWPAGGGRWRPICPATGLEGSPSLLMTRRRAGGRGRCGRRGWSLSARVAELRAAIWWGRATS